MYNWKYKKQATGGIQYCHLTINQQLRQKQSSEAWRFKVAGLSNQFVNVQGVLVCVLVCAAHLGRLFPWDSFDIGNINKLPCSDERFWGRLRPLFHTIHNWNVPPSDAHLLKLTTAAWLQFQQIIVYRKRRFRNLVLYIFMHVFQKWECAVFCFAIVSGSGSW